MNLNATDHISEVIQLINVQQATELLLLSEPHAQEQIKHQHKDCWISHQTEAGTQLPHGRETGLSQQLVKDR